MKNKKISVSNETYYSIEYLKHEFGTHYADDVIQCLIEGLKK